MILGILVEEGEGRLCGAETMGHGRRRSVARASARGAAGEGTAGEGKGEVVRLCRQVSRFFCHT